MLLAGDATHIHSPAGGQGMNTGMMDAHNLAWKLALVTDGRAPDAPLDTYGQERVPVASGVHAFTDKLVGLLTMRNRAKRAVRDTVIPVVSRLPVIQRGAARKLSQLSVAYPRSPLIQPGGHGRRPKPGDRFPDIEVRSEHGPARLHHLLGSGRHVLVVSGADVRGVLEMAGVGRNAELVDVVDGDPGSGFALIRPDGILAARGSARHTYRVADYLRRSYKSLTPPEWAGRDRDALAQLRRTGVFQPYDKEYVHRDGHRVPVLVGAAVVNRRPLRWVTFVVDLTARQRGERERAELLLRERAAREEAGQAQDRLAFLLDAGALAAATRDRQELAERLAGLVVPSFADYCVVFLPTGDGRLRVAALSHRDPGCATAFGRLREHPITTTGPMTAQVAYRTGTVQLVTDVSAELPGWAEAEPALADVLARSHPQSALAAPLTATGQRLGVMVMGRDTGRTPFADADVAVAEELSRRLAAALANADAFAREHNIAETLQRSLLPDALPVISGLDLATRYLPATDGAAAVGGDWYDAYPAGAGRVGLVIGDVIGHNITSASIMGQIRTMLRAYALDNPSPGDLLRRTNLTLARLLPEAMATVTCALLDPATGDLSYASAGHPPPLLTTGTGTEYLDEATGIMLGTGIDAAFPVVRRRLPAGAGLLLYTDGLIEDRRRDISAGLGVLARALRQSAGRTAEQMCTAAQQAMLGTAPRSDDVCLLAVRTLSR